MIFGKKKLFFKNNFTRINACKFLHHKSHLNPFLSYLPYIVRREYFSIILNVKKCALYSIKYGNCELKERLPRKSGELLLFELQKFCTNAKMHTYTSKLELQIVLTTWAALTLPFSEKDEAA